MGNAIRAGRDHPWYVQPSLSDGRFRNGEDLVPASERGRNTCEFNSRLARLVLGSPHFVFWEWVENTVFSKPDPGSLADFISSFSTWEADRLRGQAAWGSDAGSYCVDL